MSRGIYKGAALQLVDDKLRVAIPAPIRNTILGNSAGDTRVTVAVHPDQQCLMGHDLPWGVLENDRIDQLLATTDKAQVDYDYRRETVNGEDLTFDTSGRFVMLGFHKKKARIGKHAFFYGLGNHFEIWDPATLLATGKYDVMREHCEFLLEERGIAL